MALKFEITKEEFEALEEAQQALYSEHGDGYRLQVDGIDPADELKEALRKEREERAEAKRKLQEFESEAEKRERERLEKQQEWEQLSKTERERAEKLERDLTEERQKNAEFMRRLEAEKICAQLIDKDATNGVKRHKQLMAEAMQHISHTPEGIKINGPDGDAWDAKKLGEFLAEDNPHLVDGSKATGGGAPGGKGGGAVTKKFSEHTGAELKALKEQDPEAYKRLRDEHHQQR